MISIRKSPFRPDEDPKLLMIEEVAREADGIGESLAEAERKLLASEGTRDVGGKTDVRLRELVRGILRREAEIREWERNPRCFSAAVEWAGDQEYPYVVQLAEDVGKALQSESPASRENWKDLALLALTVLGLSLVVLAAIAVLMVIQQ